MRTSSRADRTVPFALHASAMNYGDIIDLRLWSHTDIWRRTLNGIQFDICFEWKRERASNCFRRQLEFSLEPYYKTYLKGLFRKCKKD
ncbi:hypothetical protein CEXT_762971 [Caerostris extrusa]|uniref:Uncharacterized protein n=1 Tax=Caerostris extrusa TaxID=172846 RepID=A0AAV4PIB2_CAEEX|nr:hypothetical protein CEXT_762971 [Caerostris extrusa]